MRWSQKVKQRDGKCAICQTPKNLTAHHLYSKSRYPMFSEDLNNGITLCQKHHQEFHDQCGNQAGFGFAKWLLNQQRVSRSHKDKVFQRVCELQEKLEELQRKRWNHNKSSSFSQTKKRFVLLQTSVSENEFDTFQSLCQALSLTPQQALHRLVHDEGQAWLKKEKVRETLLSLA
ncbi:HNH endonuclease [Seinonella peptonophila]|uniref:HNH endonuclease n=1 Tax=Seinonella peptonophila TaxID=112248 RepID=A0A1M5AY89_9BACL|nr:HNH endonuclease signature motif containing protein [Seinonella peptonophila]SHF35047.1 HNH endonuclease [Seinonella peptonophila]